VATPVADTLVVPAGILFARAGRGSPPLLPITLGFDGANPENLCVRAEITGTVPEGTLARIEYKLAGAQTWRSGPFCSRVRLSDFTGVPATVAAQLRNAFVGFALGVAAASAVAQTFDVRLAVYPPASAPVQYFTAQHTLKPLPVAPAITHTCTPASAANFATFLATLPNQSGAPVHVRMGPGTYTWNDLLWDKGGTAEFPIFLSAAALGDVIINTPNGRCMRIGASHVVHENLRYTGSGVDAGLTPASIWQDLQGGAASQSNWTFINTEVLGFDVGSRCFEQVNGFGTYRSRFIGNNPWAAAFLPNGFGGTGNNSTWNDHGLCWPGVGNWALECEFKGFGDTWRSYANSSSKQYVAGSGITRCDIRNSGDDMLEADGTCGSYAFRSRGVNVGNGFSCDDTFGPVVLAQCLVVNPSRGPVKLTSTSFGTQVLNCTFVMTAKGPADHGILTPGGTLQTGFQLINTVAHYIGVGNALYWSGGLAEDKWESNAWFPDRGFLIQNVTGTHATLAAAKTAHPQRFANDVLLSAQPFALAITLGANATTEYIGNPTGELAPGEAARASGVPVPGVTDGFSGAAPDRGCFVTGQAAVQYGVPTSTPLWSRPAPGTSAQIGYAKNAHPLGLPATYSQLDPVNFAAWNPGPASGLWAGSGTKGNKPWSSANAFGGAFWSESLQCYVKNGGGHVAFCPTTPQLYNAATLAFEWAAIPLPADGLSLVPAITSASQIDTTYPAGYADTSWGEWLGSYTGNAAQYRQPGKIFPFSVHSYYGCFTVPGSAHGNVNGALIICSAGTGNGEATGSNPANSINACHHFDLDTRVYERAANKRTGAWSAASGGTCYHPGVNRGFACTSGPTAAISGIDVYEPSTRTWSTSTITNLGANQVVATADAGGLAPWYSPAFPQGLLLKFVPQNASGVPTRNSATSVQIWAISAVAALSNGGTFTRLNVNATSWPEILAADSGDMVGPTCAAIGWAFVPPLARHFAVNGQHGSNTLWKLSPPASASTLADLLTGTWTVTTETLTGPGLESKRATFDGETGTGGRFVYNRLAYNAAKNCLMYMPEGINQRVSVLTPAGL
jgi:hypothetical protein